MEQLINDIGTIRTHLNSTELQLYEANEKISELIESVIIFFFYFCLYLTKTNKNLIKQNYVTLFFKQQHLLEKENKSIKVDNSNLTDVAKLLTANMKDSVATSKK